MAQALQTAQQSMQNAGQQQAQRQEASEDEMGAEFGASGQRRQRQGSGQGQGAQGQRAAAAGAAAQAGTRAGAGGRGQGMGGPGQGAGGRAGVQQPLPGVKQDSLVKAVESPGGTRLTRSFKGLPDPTRDRAAYYEVNGEARRAAEASLNREPIPAGYQKAVKSYFEQIQSPR